MIHKADYANYIEEHIDGEYLQWRHRSDLRLQMTASLYNRAIWYVIRYANSMDYKIRKFDPTYHFTGSYSECYNECLSIMNAESEQFEK